MTVRSKAELSKKYIGWYLQGGLTCWQFRNFVWIRWFFLTFLWSWYFWVPFYRITCHGVWTGRFWLFYLFDWGFWRYLNRLFYRLHLIISRFDFSHLLMRFIEVRDDRYLICCLTWSFLFYILIKLYQINYKVIKLYDVYLINKQ